MNNHFRDNNQMYCNTFKILKIAKYMLLYMKIDDSLTFEY